MMGEWDDDGKRVSGKLRLATKQRQPGSGAIASRSNAPLEPTAEGIAAGAAQRNGEERVLCWAAPARCDREMAVRKGFGDGEKKPKSRQTKQEQNMNQCERRLPKSSSGDVGVPSRRSSSSGWLRYNGRR